MLYFAYGSNLDSTQMRERCSGGFCFKVGSCPKDFGVAFTRRSTKRGGGVAYITPVEGEDVWGVVFAITTACAECLDRHEVGYRREDVQIVGKDGQATPAMAYVVSRKEEGLKSLSAYIAFLGGLA